MQYSYRVRVDFSATVPMWTYTCPTVAGVLLAAAIITRILLKAEGHLKHKGWNWERQPEESVRDSQKQPVNLARVELLVGDLEMDFLETAGLVVGVGVTRHLLFGVIIIIS